jgi:phage/plasmid-associated DNA primase
MVLLKSEFTDGDVGDYVVGKYKDILQIDESDIYVWEEGRGWKKSPDGGALMYLLDTTVYKEIKTIIDQHFDKAADFKKYLKLLSNVNRLRNVAPRKNYIAQIMNTLKITQTPVEFDNKPNLLCFTNGVYDLDTDTFRAVRKEDYISQVINYDYKVSSKQETDALMTWITQIMPKEDERDCLLRALSSCLYGKVLENVIILTGQGRNGKDTLITGLLSKTLSNELYYNNSTSVITTPYKGGVCQERANMDKKRTVVYSEPSKNETLKCANLKELTGCPTLNSRGLYSTKTTIQNFATTLILTNAIPTLDVVDNAISNRLVIIPFRSIFLTEDSIRELPEGQENVFPVNTYYKTEEFISKSKLPFMNILLTYFKDFRRDGYILTRISQPMRELSKAYMSESDDFVNWLYSVYEKTNDAHAYVKMKEVYARYKTSDLYENLSKKDKRKNNYEKLNKDVKENPNLRVFHCARIEIRGRNITNVLLGHRTKVEEPSDDDEE